MIGVAFIRAKTQTQLMCKSAVCEKEEQNFLQEEKSKMKSPCGKSSQIQLVLLLSLEEMVLQGGVKNCACFPFVLLLPILSNKASSLSLRGEFHGN